MRGVNEMEPAARATDDLLRQPARMLTKQEVAALAGMSVSWLDNSRSDKAVKMRAVAVRYGRSHSSPVRFPSDLILQLCLEDESGRPDSPREPPARDAR